MRIKYRNQKLLSADASVQLAISNIELYCRNEGITKLFLTGSEIEHVDKAIITKIVEGLSAKGVQTVYGENICYDAAAMREASEAGHVVLVEITNVSIFITHENCNSKINYCEHITCSTYNIVYITLYFFFRAFPICLKK